MAEEVRPGLAREFHEFFESSHTFECNGCSAKKPFTDRHICLRCWEDYTNHELCTSCATEHEKEDDDDEEDEKKKDKSVKHKMMKCATMRDVPFITNMPLPFERAPGSFAEWSADSWNAKYADVRRQLDEVEHIINMKRDEENLDRKLPVSSTAGAAAASTDASSSSSSSSTSTSTPATPSKQGFLTKKATSGPMACYWGGCAEKFRERYVVLENQTFKYFADKKQLEIPLREFPVSHIRRVQEDVEGESPLAFAIITPERDFVFTAPDASEKKEWLEVLTLAKDHTKEPRKSVVSSPATSSSAAPPSLTPAAPSFSFSPPVIRIITCLIQAKPTSVTDRKQFVLAFMDDIKHALDLESVRDVRVTSVVQGTDDTELKFDVVKGGKGLADHKAMTEYLRKLERDMSNETSLIRRGKLTRNLIRIRGE
eukprot:TRINITY_DN2173_c0_g1_i6.p1 TRINITY_DN2173_c0_g1~~TRINITY_DN2173_c0_g1_i6.p1  ORF type:complete len:502 (-),score=209.88 TRINITY_DN2173_c0_g1_i6:92-1372(-)